MIGRAGLLCRSLRHHVALEASRLQPHWAAVKRDGMLLELKRPSACLQAWRVWAWNFMV